MKTAELTQYFDRIGLLKKPRLNEAGLSLIHRHQHRNIPFENLDIINGQPILLTQQALFDKLVQNKRGGYCHELNGLLLNALQTIGFEARSLLARVHIMGEPTSRSHRVSLVTLDEQEWLVDAGFGSSTPRAPLPMEFNREISTDIQTFRFIQDELYGVMLQVKDGGDWTNLYSLDMTYVCDADIECSNHFTSTHPNSVFTTKCVASMPRENGIVTLVNRTIKIKQNDKVTEINLGNEATYFEGLKEYFNLAPKVDYKKLVLCFES